ncbi:F-box/LRR-repeat protein [Anopheles sinensis]|uniref:F-box/LRR-repeat protein n=1 Tax=Anopheles sinensis TaxID=74873 RepID=A0A084WJB7_ANOSI|nr:F-box/LRR-repeat protein [Anopheles sinensis]
MWCGSIDVAFSYSLFASLVLSHTIARHPPCGGRLALKLVFHPPPHNQPRPASFTLPALSSAHLCVGHLVADNNGVDIRLWRPVYVTGVGASNTLPRAYARLFVMLHKEPSGRAPGREGVRNTTQPVFGCVLANRRDHAHHSASSMPAPPQATGAAAEWPENGLHGAFRAF